MIVVAQYANLLTEQKETQEAEKRRELTTQEEALTEVSTGTGYST